MITNVMDMLEWVEYASSNKTLMLIRTVGPDGCTDVEKIDHIYSAYHLNLDSEHPLLFDTLLRNEFTIAEFDTEENARDFAIDNFPLRASRVDADYFVQVFVFCNGNLSYANDSLTGLSSRIPMPTAQVI